MRKRTMTAAAALAAISILCAAGDPFSGGGVHASQTETWEETDESLAREYGADEEESEEEKEGDGEEREETLVSYLGPAGTYTEEAVLFFFQNAEELLPEKTVEEAIADVVGGKADYAVIPQENTLGGAVTNYVDALIGEEDVFVVGEIILPISQTLLGVPGARISDIQTVCSHAQGLKQSEEWRKEHMPDAVTEEMASTAAAASFVAEQQDKSIAAVAAPGAADLYGLSVLAENVQITDANKTRFYVLSAERLEDGDLNRAAFVASCEANRIDDIIIEVHEQGLEIVAIHDRPEGSGLGSYHYMIEVEAEDGVSEEQISSIGGLEEVRFIGVFDMVEKGVEKADSDI